MRGFLLPIVFVVLPIGLFLVYINPTYSKIQTLQAERDQYDEALNKSKELQAIRDQLLSRYNTFPEADIQRLEKLLPDNVDNVRLVLDIDDIASKYGLRIQNVTVTDNSKLDDGSRPEIGESNGSVSSVLLSFRVSASYSNFVAFMKNLEESLRIVDVVSLSFTASETDFNEYTVTIRTYWLK